jgi:hypothetical protein
MEYKKLECFNVEFFKGFENPLQMDLVLGNPPPPPPFFFSLFVSRIKSQLIFFPYIKQFSSFFFSQKI